MLNKKMYYITLKIIYLFYIKIVIPLRKRILLFVSFQISPSFNDMQWYFFVEEYVKLL
jgi:hypothetical protein